MTAATATYVVELTATGRAAVAVVLVAGPVALDAISRSFAPKKPWAAEGPAIGSPMLGRWGGDGGEELIVCRRADDRFEVCCHGGVAAVRSIVARLTQLGCEPIGWPEWLRRSVANPIQASAQIALAQATTARTAGVLLDQYNGALSAAVRSAREAVKANDPARAVQVIDGILQYADVGLHLTKPWQVVLAGAPNVGKSSLINAIAGYRRAIVSPTPGTTRDVVTVTTAIDGWPVQLADTAGLRETQDEIESAGVALTGAALADADLAIVVADVTTANDGIAQIDSCLPERARVMRVLNKIDLANEIEHALTRCGTQSVSALTGEGLVELIAAIGRTLVPAAPPSAAAVAFTSEQILHLVTARSALAGGDGSAADAALTALLS